MRGCCPLLFLVTIALVAAFAVAGPGVLGGEGARALEVVSGDSDCNGEVDVADVTSGLMAEAGLAGGCFQMAGDVDCDGAADQADLLRLLGHIGGVPMTQPGGCAAIGQPRELPPTSHELIDAARTGGDISLGDALLYHLYADLGDDRLPGEYEGANGGSLESSIFDQIASAWDGLPQDERDALRPYLLVPTDPDSWMIGLSSFAGGVEWLPIGRGSDSTGAVEVVSGDNDCDGEVNAADVTSGLVEIAGTNGGCFDFAGDVNCSGASDVSDILRLLRHFADVPATQPGGCVPTGQPRTLPPTSHELVEEALAGGEITKGEALLYHLYADLGDNQLPDEYVGPNHGPLESSIFQEIVTVWDSLSSAEQSALEPYLLPPTPPNGWIEQGDVGAASAIQWETVSSDRIKVWWQTRRPEDEAKAHAE